MYIYIYIYIQDKLKCHRLSPLRFSVKSCHGYTSHCDIIASPQCRTCRTRDAQHPHPHDCAYINLQGN